MKIKTFDEVIAINQEKAAKESADRAARIKKEVADSIRDIGASVEAAMEKIVAYCGEQDLQYDKILDLMDEISLSERRQRQLQKLIDDLFPPKAVAQ